MTKSPYAGNQGRKLPFAVILGTNEIASAVAIGLFRAGYAVVLSYDPLPPVIRRKMAFHDALFDDPVAIAGVAARLVDSTSEIRSALMSREAVLITELGLLDLMVVRTLDVLVDARLQKYHLTPDLRRLARLSIGVGPGFTAGANCDFAIETHPGQTGQIIRCGGTEAPDGIARQLGSAGKERFVYSAAPGRWHTAVEIGTRIFKNFIAGHLDGEPIRAPFDGILRGVVRDGTEVPEGIKLLEIDPRGRRAAWSGIDARARTIAAAVTKTLSIHSAEAKIPLRPVLTVIK